MYLFFKIRNVLLIYVLNVTGKMNQLTGKNILPLITRPDSYRDNTN